MKRKLYQHEKLDNGKDIFIEAEPDWIKIILNDLVMFAIGFLVAYSFF